MPNMSPTLPHRIGLACLIEPRTLLCALLLLGCASCDGFACSGQGYDLSSDPQFAPSTYLDPALGVTVTAEAGDFASQQGPALLAAFLGEPGAAVAAGDWIDISDFVNSYLAGNDIHLFSVSARDIVAAARIPDLDGLSVTFLSSPARVHVEIARLWMRLEATVVDDFTNSACRIRGDVDPGPDQRMFSIENMAIDLVLGVTADGGFDVRTDVLSLHITESGIGFVTDPADPWYYCNLPECADGTAPQCGECVTVCSAADFATDVGSFLVETFSDVIVAVTERIVNNILANVTTLTGRLHPALLLGSLLDDVYDAEFLRLGALPSQQGLIVRPRPDRAASEGDLQTFLALGVEADAEHPCVAPSGPPPAYQVSPLQALYALPGAHVALGIPGGFADQILWGIYRSGALCLDVDAQTVTDLTGGNIQLTAGLLSLLLPGLEELAPADAPLLLSLRPHLQAADFPVIAFNPVTPLSAPASGMVRINLPRTSIGIYALVDGTTSRLFEVDADVLVEVTPMIMPDGGLAIGIDRVDVTNLVETYDELFRGVELDKLFGFIVELVGRVLVGNELSLPVPLDQLAAQMLGVPLTLEFSDFAVDGPSEDWLTLSVAMGLAGSPLHLQAETAFASDAVPPERLAVGDALTVQLAAADARPIEVQWRLDGLAWSGPRSGPRVTIDSHLLRAPGTHTVELRARYVAQVQTLDPTPLRFTVRVLEASPEPNQVDVDDDATLSGGCQIGRTRGAGEPVSLLALLGLLGVVWVRRGASRARVRRRMPAQALLLTLAVCAAVVAGLVAGCDDDVPSFIACSADRDCPQGQLCGCSGSCSYATRCATNADCCGGRACVDGLCETRFECRIDDDCGAGYVCESCQCRRSSCTSSKQCPGNVCNQGVCQAPEHIPCEAACTDTEVCLVERDVCVPRGNICPQTECPVGQQLVLSEATGLLGESCDFKGIGCGCREAPPLPLPQPGAYVASALAGDRIAVFAYESHYGDLLVLEGDGPGGLEQPRFLDGVPAARPTGDPSGPRGGIGALGDDIGQHVSAVTRRDGAVAAASYDATHGALRVGERVSGSAAWSAVTVDDDGDAGRYASLAALSDGRLVVAYQVTQTLVDGRKRSTLRVATERLVHATAGADYFVVDVESMDLSDAALVCAGQCARDELCLAADQSCARPDPDSVCGGTCALGTGCVEGTCQPIVASTDPAAHLIGTGVDVDVVPLADGLRVAILFYRAATGELVVATGPASGPFSTKTLDAGSTRAGFGDADVGRAAAGDADATDKVHVAYVDEVSGTLLYGVLDPADGSFTAPEIITLGRAGNPGRRLGGVDLLVTRADEVIVAYQDTSDGRLEVARRASGATAWTFQVIDDAGVAGFSPSLLETPTGLYVAHGRILSGNDGRPVRDVQLLPL